MVGEAADGDAEGFGAFVSALRARLEARGHALDVFAEGPELLRQDSIRPLGELRERPLRAVRRLGAYDVLQVHHFGLWDAAPLLGYAAAGARVVFVGHRAARGGSGRRGSVGALCDRMAARRLSRVVGVSRHVCDRLEGRWSLPEGRAVAIPLGVACERFACVRTVRDHDRPLELVTRARLSGGEGVDVLLEAAGLLGDGARLTVLGDGPQRPALERLAAELGLGERVRFLPVRSEDVPALLRAADVFVRPAVSEDSFGLSVGEAMASGLPVVATRVGSAPEWVIDCDSGLLVEPGNHRELAAALRLLMDGPNLSRRLGGNAAARASLLFSVERSAARHVELLEEVACASLAVQRP